MNKESVASISHLIATIIDIIELLQLIEPVFFFKKKKYIYKRSIIILEE